MSTHNQSLYCLLSNGEDPKKDGIMAKCQSLDEYPTNHIEEFSSSNGICHWVSTCADQDALKRLINRAKSKLPKEKQSSSNFRVAEIDKQKVVQYADKCKYSIERNEDIFEFNMYDDKPVRTIPRREMTGDIEIVLDLSDKEICEKYQPQLPEGRFPLKCVREYEEIIIERFIPPHCCISVETIVFDKDNLLSKRKLMSPCRDVYFLSESELTSTMLEQVRYREAEPKRFPQQMISGTLQPPQQQIFPLCPFPQQGHQLQPIGLPLNQCQLQMNSQYPPQNNGTVLSQPRSYTGF